MKKKNLLKKVTHIIKCITKGKCQEIIKRSKNRFVLNLAQTFFFTNLYINPLDLQKYTQITNSHHVVVPIQKSLARHQNQTKRNENPFSGLSVH